MVDRGASRAYRPSVRAARQAALTDELEALETGARAARRTAMGRHGRPANDVWVPAARHPAAGSIARSLTRGSARGGLPRAVARVATRLGVDSWSKRPSRRCCGFIRRCGGRSVTSNSVERRPSMNVSWPSPARDGPYMHALMMFAEARPAPASAIPYVHRRHLQSRIRRLSQETVMSRAHVALTGTALVVVVLGASVGAVSGLPMRRRAPASPGPAFAQAGRRPPDRNGSLCPPRL